MSQTDEQLDQAAAAEFSAALCDGDLSVLEAALAALASPEFTDQERNSARAALLMLCVKCYPTRLPAAIDSLLAAGTSVELEVDTVERVLCGMRVGLHCSRMSALAQAIDNGDRATVQRLFDAANDRRGPGIGYEHVPYAGLLWSGTEDANRYSANALAFAVACGQTEILHSMLGQLDTGSAGVRATMGAALDCILATGLLVRGPDGVLADVVTLIGRGANLSNYAIHQLTSCEIRLDNGGDLSHQEPWRHAPFAALTIVALHPDIGAQSGDVASTLVRLHAECEADLCSLAMPDFPGTTLMDLADYFGSREVGAALSDAGLRHRGASTKRNPSLIMPALLGNASFEIAPEVLAAIAPNANGAQRRAPSVQKSSSDVAGIYDQADSKIRGADLFYSLRQRQERRSETAAARPQP